MPFVPDDSTSSLGRFVPDEQPQKPEPGFLEKVRDFGSRFIDTEVAGMDAAEKRRRQQEFDRANALYGAQVAAQTNSLSDAERAQQAAGAAAQEQYRNSVGGRVVDTASAAVDLTRDLGLGLVKGGANTLVKLPLAVSGVVEDVTGARQGMEGLGYRSKDALGVVEHFGKRMDSLKSDAGQARDRDFNATKGVIDTLGELGANPAMIMDKVSESLVGIGVIGKTAGAAVEQALPWLAARAKASGLVGQAADDFIIQGATKIAQVAAPVSEGIQSGLDIAGTAQEAGRTLDQYGKAALVGGVFTAGVGALSNKLGAKAGIGDIETDIALRGTRSLGAKTGTGGVAERILKEGAKEGFAEELPQSIGESVAENVAMGRPWDQGLGKAAVTGALTGFGMGGAHAAFTREGGQPAGPTTPPAASPEQKTNTHQAPANNAQPATNNVATPNANAVGTNDTTEAEKALRTPVTLTALDRANEIDIELGQLQERRQELAPENGYGPVFDQERTELDTKAQALDNERQDIAKTWPKSELGAQTNFSTESGVRLDGQYALMDAGDLVTSHDENLRANPMYPAELQPRDRSRSASELQVSGIVQKLDPARLGLSADAATGAPIVGADGLVESGNARTIALKRVYQANGQKAEDYRDFLRSNAAQFGITPESVDGMANPVLVRVRSTPVNRAEFARQANASTVQRMSPSEQALSDSKRLTSLEGLNPDDNGDFDTSHGFIRQFMGMLPVTEQSDMIESDGKLSTFGYRRIQNAVLAKAYGDSPTLRRMTESMDDDLRNITKALTRVAPVIASARERMASGTLHQADVSPDLLAAVEGLSTLKKKGWSAADELGQSDLTGPKYTPEAAQLLTFLDANMRSPRRIAEFLQRYYEALESAGDPNQASMFDDAPAPTRAGLLNAAQQGAQNANINQDPKRGINREGAQAGTQGEQQPQNAPGNSGGNEGDGPAGSTGDVAGRASGPQGQNGTDWVAFPPESGTLGIPRVEMPQVKQEHRGALVNFLGARGITNTRETVPAESLKATQAEYAPGKVARFAGWKEGRDRAVLVSNDGYVLDGHHQWVAKMQNGEPVEAIRFNAPIRKLLAEVGEFPSVGTSDGATSDNRARAVQDFKDALGDLALIATRHTRVMMVKEDLPDFMPAMVKLYDAGIRILGTDLKRLRTLVKAQMKADPKLKTFWNKVSDTTHQKAALQALNAMDKPAQGGLFDGFEAATEALQGDVFAAAAPEDKAGSATKSESKEVQAAYDRNRDDFKPPHVTTFLPAELISRANGYIKKYAQKAQTVVVSPMDRARAELVLRPMRDAALQAFPEFARSVAAVAKEAGALGQIVGSVKALNRSVEKFVNPEDANFELEKMRDMLRATVVVSSYDDAQAVVDAVAKSFGGIARVKNRTSEESRLDGYADILLNVALPNGVMAEIQINVPEMLAAKGVQGHELYEAQRVLPKDSATYKELGNVMRELYTAAFSAAGNRVTLPVAANSRQPRAQLRNAASDMLAADRAGNALTGSKSTPLSSSLKTLPSGNSTNSSPPKDAMNSQPGGNLSGTFIETPPALSLSELAKNGVSLSDPVEAANARMVVVDKPSSTRLSRNSDQTDTPAFKKWYGDWQGETNGSTDNGRGSSDVNAIQRPGELGVDTAGGITVGNITFPGASGPVGRNGKPVVFFHGTRDNVYAFDTQHPNRKDKGWLGRGVYAASDPLDAESYSRLKAGPESPRVMPLFMAVKNPYIASKATKELYRDASQEKIDAFTKDLKDKGHDGVVMEFSDGSVELMAFDSTKVKSAIGNSGAFDGTKPDIRLSRDTGGGMDHKALDTLVANIRSKNPNMPTVHVLADPSTAPKGLRDYITEQNAWGDVEGAMHGGELYLFASGLSDPLRAEHVLAEHEAAHFGLRAVFGPSLKTAMNLVWVQNAAVRKAATALQKRGKLTNADATEEVIVDIPTGELAKLQGWRKVTAMARDWLAGHGYTHMAQKLTDWLEGSLSDQQRADLFVAELVRGARDYIAGKRPGKSAMGTGTRLSATLAEDIAVQERWLTTEAKARGFKDIEDLLEKNYPLFEKLAELWRKKNPADSLLSRGTSKASALRSTGFDKASATVVADFRNDNPLKAHPDYKDAKAGDVAAAARLVQALVKPANLEKAREKFGSDVVYVPVHAEEARGRNAIPVALAAHYAQTSGATLGLDVVQSNRAFHTGANAIERLIARTTFTGSVQAGQRYVMVDDVTTMGSTLADLASHIRSQGGVVAGSVLLTNGTRGGIMEPSTKTIKELEVRHGNEISKLFSIEPSALTGSEAQYLIGFRTTDELRSKVAAARLARQSRLLAKGVSEAATGLSDSALSRAVPGNNAQTPQQRAETIIQTKAGTRAPLDALAKGLTKITGIERLTGAIYDRAGFLLDKITPEKVKAGIVSDYGVPETVIDQRAMMQGRKRVQLRKVGSLVEKLSTLTRAESRVAYAWMNEKNDTVANNLIAQLPEQSVQVLQDVRKMIDRLSRDAVQLGQLSPEVYERNKFAYLRRSYEKHIFENVDGEKTKVAGAKGGKSFVISGEQYKGRGMTEDVVMQKIENNAPGWWKRKMVPGKADTAIKGQRFFKLQQRAANGQGVQPLEGMDGKGAGKVVNTMFWPVDEPIPRKFSEWEHEGEWEARDTNGKNVEMWRDYTKAERETMGEIDEARFAITKTLHGMVQDVETGRYLEWLAVNQAKKPGEDIPGKVVEASDHYLHAFAPGEWVKVPDTKIDGTSVFKYGKLAGRYLPGPVWNDLRQTVNGQFRPFGDTFTKILSVWKTSKTALSPAVHTNNVMSNFVMADWHDVTAGHTAKALRILLGAHSLSGTGAIGTVGNAAARVIGTDDREAATEVVNRYLDSGGDIGSWATNEIQHEQLEPLLEAMEKELVDTNGNSAQAQIGVMSALQFAKQGQLSAAWEAAKGSWAGKAVVNEASHLIELYQSEDEVFRLAAWLKAKEDGLSDLEAGKIARRSFMDYSINAPWISAMRNSALPFISYSYRAIPMLLDIAAHKPHKLMKLMLLAGGLNALGGMLAGGGGDDDEKERKLLPEEKAGSIWGMVPKLIRMPWNDDHGSAVYLDIRRFIPVGDVLDVGAGHSAIPLLPFMSIGGPLAMLSEIFANKTNFTGKPIVLETDTPMEKTTKILDYLYKAFAPNILGLPGTYATSGVADTLQSNNGKGRTDKFGRELSTVQALASSFGVKLGSYPKDVLARNLQGAATAKIMEIDKNIGDLKRQYSTNQISQDQFRERAEVQQDKKRKVVKELAEKLH